MKKNLIFVPIKKLFKKNFLNIYFGKIDPNDIIKKKFKILELNNDFTYLNKSKDRKLMKIFYEKKMNQLTEILNNFHKCNYERRFWEIIIGPFLERMIFLTRDKWLSIKKNKKVLRNISCSVYEYNNRDIKISDYSEFNKILSEDKINNYIYFQAYKLFNIKSKKNFLFKKNFTKSIKRDFQKRSILYKLYEFLFLFIKKKQKYLFYYHYLSKKNYFLLTLNLNNLPFHYDEFNFCIKGKKNRQFLKSKLQFDSVSKFEFFFNEMLYDFMPSSYIENFKKLHAYSDNLKFDSKIIFSSLGQTVNDTFKIWSAIKVIDGSKLIASDHGGQFEDVIDFYSDRIYNLYLRWIKSEYKKFVHLPPNHLLNYKNKNYQNESNRILILLPLRVRHRRSFLHRNGNEFDEYEFIKSQLIYCFEKDIDKIYFRFHPASRYKKDLERHIKLDFGTNKIDNTLKFEDTIKNYKLIIDTNLDTSWYQLFKFKVPFILFNRIEFIKINNQKKKLLKEMGDKKIYFNDLKKSKKLLNSIIKDPESWWNSNEIDRFKEKISGFFGINEKNDLFRWINFFRNI